MRGRLVSADSLNSKEASFVPFVFLDTTGLMTYASENCGFFPAHLTDLTRSDGTPIAIPNYPDDAPEFLGGYLARADSYVKAATEEATSLSAGRTRFRPLALRTAF